jgi:hypothetical protein
MRQLPLLALTTALFVPQTWAQTDQATDPSAGSEDKAKPCSSAEHRAFDFWLGQWQVTSPERPGWQASSSITLGNNGCSLHEAYSSPGGYAGSSVNFYDSARGRWHQSWIDNQGAPLYLEGKFEQGSMILSDGKNRITWSVQADRTVRQHWQISQDEGKTWSTAFDGYYRRLKPD